MEFPDGTVVRTWRFHCCGPGSVPGWGMKILQATRCSQKKKKEEINNIENRDHRVTFN